jgi:hypothetical protein
MSFQGLKKGHAMWKTLGAALATIITVSPTVGSADDLIGSTRFLCSAVQATQCFVGGECGIDLPWNLNIPQFIEIDLESKMLSTTAASGASRTTPIEHLESEGGVISLQGSENGRGFTFVIDEETGQLTVAIATRGEAVIVFGACTPLAQAAGSGSK